MDIHYPPHLITSLKNKHLLLDTNIFIDAAGKMTVFIDFFDTLKNENVTITTIDLVKWELLKGSSDATKYHKKETFMNDIIDLTLPLTSHSSIFVTELIKLYGIYGNILHITDLFLGATLMQYKQNIYLMTRDTSDFLQSIFDLSFIVNIPHNKGIFTYGIYQYTK